MRNNTIVSLRSKKVTLFILALILIAAAFLRIYRLADVPPAISWDEAAVGYNAYTIANWGKDEWGRSFPLVFKSFGDDKNPVHFYFTAVTVKLLGLSEFSTRLPAAIFGIFNVILLYLLAQLFFKSQLAGLSAAFMLAISPYALQFSRFNHELNFALFFFILGLYFFLKAVNGKHSLLPVSLVSFGISIITYHSAKVVVPPMMVLLVLLYAKSLWKIKKIFLLACLAFVFIMSSFLLEPALLGMSRYQQTTIQDEEIKTTGLYKKTNSKLLGSLEVMSKHYIVHFTPEYLFVSGDPIPRHSTQSIGHFFKIEALFIILGAIGLLLKPTKVSIILFIWLLLAPLPVAPNGGADGKGHAGRAMFMMGSLNLISVYGFSLLISLVRKKIIQGVIIAVTLSIIFYQFYGYINYYYGEFGRRYAIEWQYGMKQIVEYLKAHNGYFQVYTTFERGQPYIFFLYYLQTPLPKLLETVSYDQTKYKLSNTVDYFDKYYFGGWDPLESMPNPGVLYVLTPSQYDGLRYRDVFYIKKLVRYPNGLDAFFLVSYP